MPIIPSGIVHQGQLRSAIEAASRGLSPDVKRIRYSVMSDSTGAESIFIRVLLSDAASRPDRLYETTERISGEILEIVKPLESFGMEAYFNFRSEAEQAKLRDAAWE